DSLDVNADKIGTHEARQTSPVLEGTHKRGHVGGMLTWEHPWCEPWRELLAHPKLIPYLNTLFGRGWKLDHMPDVLTSTKGAEGLALHGQGSLTFSGSRFYAFHNGTMRCGLINCQFYLADQNPGDGGLCVIPGSHKANLAVPRAIADYEEDREIVYSVPAKAGDLVIFNEATTHGTLSWTADHERRVALYRFTPKYLHYTGGAYETSLPEWTSELNGAQRAVLEPPYVYNRALIEDDGKSLTSPRREGE
ncbi:MAG: phytanoyl-CoA dioxygenase family protein, partial [Pseudomonadota bacterium]|nr:phytanoyl-CoA dioxygenase family protein [Pseudomonadota bacterium]